MMFVIDIILIILNQAIWMAATYIDKVEITFDLLFSILVVHIPALIFAAGILYFLLRNSEILHEAD